MYNHEGMVEIFLNWFKAIQVNLKYEKHTLYLETSMQFKMSYMTDLELVYFMANWYTCPILQ